MNDTDTQQTVSEAAAETYEPPRLTAIGTIEELTLVEDLGEAQGSDHGSKVW